MKLLALFAPEMHILICTHSNSAANLYVEGLHMDWNSELGGGGQMEEKERERVRVKKWDGRRAVGRRSPHIPTVQLTFMLKGCTRGMEY